MSTLQEFRATSFCTRTMTNSTSDRFVFDLDLSQRTALMPIKMVNLTIPRLLENLLYRILVMFSKRNTRASRLL
ncbi:hypothetical protein ATCV1_z693L [Acanthocystis turfacea chlorella virus 1]|uniref:Uncharacterized protein z693L n=1 Tax=Chlorovirus heliozoae TaxID=322019 RepID=A7K9V3_9PHYC|nr:hypothetical protein ATCV1_z693L [Acanthocystis turfacea chlorella virus 1]ABT16827.1 hypothetical protein ATCV1_z693L [Acanthocystis turfacea chlorella virus 1]